MMKVLTLALFCAFASGHSATAQNWSFYESSDPITDEKSYGALVRFPSPYQGPNRHRNRSFSYQCDENGEAFVLDTKTVLRLDASDGFIRVDKETAHRVRFTIGAPHNSMVYVVRGLHAGEAEFDEILEELRNHNLSVFFRVGNEDFGFIQGRKKLAKSAIEQAITACKIHDQD